MISNLYFNELFSGSYSFLNSVTNGEQVTIFKSYLVLIFLVIFLRELETSCISDLGTNSPLTNTIIISLLKFLSIVCSSKNKYPD